MSFRHVMQKVKEYPQHHKLHYNFDLSHDDAGLTKRATMIPLIQNDDGIIATDVDSNPVHASFAQSSEPLCSPESKVFSISCSLQFDFTKIAWNTDKIRNLKVHIIPVACAFEDIDAVDELSTLTVGSILELMNGTDNVTHPIYNNVVIPATTGQQVDMGTNAQGLTATTALEYITFDMDQLYNALAFFSNRGKLKKCIGGIITKTLTTSADTMPGNTVSRRQGKNIIQLKINLPSKAKFMNKKTFFGLIIRIPTTGTEDNFGAATDIVGATPTVVFNLRSHFLEWNHSFNHQRTG